MTQTQNKSNSRPGYEYLVVYMLGKVIQDLTFDFCSTFLKNPKDPKYPNYRQIEQMDQAARINPQNIAEGYSQESLKGYITLSGVAKGSNEELLKDYQDYLRMRKLPIWDVNYPKIREYRAYRVSWVDENNLNTPKLPVNNVEAANMLCTFCKLESFLLTKHVESLKEKHKKEGGFSEKLHRERKEYRGY